MNFKQISKQNKVHGSDLLEVKSTCLVLKRKLLFMVRHDNIFFRGCKSLRWLCSQPTFWLGNCFTSLYFKILWRRVEFGWFQKVFVLQSHSETLFQSPSETVAFHLECNGAGHNELLKRRPKIKSSQLTLFKVDSAVYASKVINRLRWADLIQRAPI